LVLDAGLGRVFYNDRRLEEKRFILGPDFVEIVLQLEVLIHVVSDSHMIKAPVS